MPKYEVKPGAKAFIDNALRSEGYVHTTEKEIKPFPSWAVKADAKAKTAASKKSAAADAQNVKAAEREVSFTEETLTTGQTVQL